MEEMPVKLSYAKYSLKGGVQKLRTKTAIVLSGAGALLLTLSSLMVLSFAPASAANNEVIYNNIPSPFPGNVPSEAFEATSTSEFGGQVSFAGTARSNPTVTVAMSSWGCESGSWNLGTCVTTPGAKFNVPITLNVYNVGSGGEPGSLLTTATQTFAIPFRPSADATNCTGDEAGKWYSTADNKCYNGLLNTISFSLSSVTLPNNAIISVAYNTTHHGYTPVGESAACYTKSGGCGYDSLNVGLTAPPTVGTLPVANSVYQNSSWSGAYCSGTTGTFRLDGPCWTGYQPAFKVEAPAEKAPKAVGSVTGGLTLANPRQQLSFNAFDFGPNSTYDRGTVEYQNFDYPGGLHYTAPVECVTVSGNKANYMFQVPEGFPGVSGIYVVMSERDGGSPGTKDTHAQLATSDRAQALSWCEDINAMGATYKITGGNAVVH